MTTDDEINAAMSVGLLDTVRQCARDLYGECATYPCDDVKRMAEDVRRLRDALRRINDG